MCRTYLNTRSRAPGCHVWLWLTEFTAQAPSTGLQHPFFNHCHVWLWLTEFTAQAPSTGLQHPFFNHCHVWLWLTELTVDSASSRHWFTASILQPLPCLALADWVDSASSKHWFTASILQPLPCLALADWVYSASSKQRKLQALVYSIHSSTTAIVDYATGLEKLSANGHFYNLTAVKFVTDNTN